MSIKPDAQSSSGAASAVSSHVAGTEQHQLLQDFITTAGGTKRQRLGIMPPTAANDGSSPAQPAKNGAGLSAVDNGGSITSATLPPATEQATGAHVSASGGASSQASGRDSYDKENRAQPPTVEPCRRDGQQSQPGGLSGSKRALSPAADVITLSDSDDDDDDLSDGGSEEAQPTAKRELPLAERAATDSGTALPPASRAGKLRHIRMRQNELRIEEAKLLLLQRLRNSQQEQFKSQDASLKAQVAAKPASAVGPTNGAAVLVVPSRPVPSLKSPAFTSMLTGNTGLKQTLAKESATPMASIHSGQARPALNSAVKMDGSSSRPGSLSVPGHGAAAYGRQLPLTVQATSVLSRSTINQHAVVNAQASLNNGIYRPYAQQGGTATPPGLQRTPGAQNGSSGGTPGSAGRAQPSAAAAVPSGARSAGSGAAPSAYVPGRAPAQHDAATAAMLAAERQRTARLTHRKHMERIMAQIQPPRPTLRRMDFVPFLPTDSSDGFVYLLGLEEVVKYLTQKGGKEDSGNVPKHLACAKCKVDYSPSWRCDRQQAGSSDIVCERCLVARQKLVVRKDYAAKLDRVLSEVSQRDRELEMQLLSAAASVGGSGVSVVGAAAATPTAPSAAAAMSSAARGGGRRPEASEHAQLAAAGKATPRVPAATARFAYAQRAGSSVAAARNAQAAMSYQSAYDDIMNRVGIVNRVKKQYTNADVQLHLPGMVPMVRQGKHDVIH